MRINPFENNINLLFKKADMNYYILPIYNDYEKDLFDEKKYNERIKKTQAERQKFDKCFKKIWDNFQPLREKAKLRLLAEEL